jgi:hypothetical protein
MRTSLVVLLLVLALALLPAIQSRRPRQPEGPSPKRESQPA